MIYQDVKLYNVAETLSGDGEQVFDATALAQLRETNPVDYAGYREQRDKGFWLTRVPDSLRRQLNPSAHINALQATGCEVRFNLTGREATVTLQNALRPAIAEVYQGSFLVSWHVIGTEPTPLQISLPGNLPLLQQIATQSRLPYDARLTRILLPWRPPVRLLGIEGECEPPRPEQAPARRLLCYGSSITHGNTSVRPSATYASRLAQRLKADLVNLGFGGGAHLEPQMADYIASRDDWHVATLEMGINMLASFTVQDFAARVEYFISTVARSGRPVFCIDLYTCQYDAETGTEAALKLAAFRGIVSQAVARMNMPHVIYVAGRRMLPSLGYLTTDLVHPSPAGMEEIARNLAQTIQRHGNW